MSETVVAVRPPAWTRWLPLLLACVGSLLTGGIWWREQQAGDALVASELHHKLTALASAVNRRQEANVQILRGVVGLYDASDVVTRREFGRYAKSLRFANQYPGTQGIGFAQWIPAAQLARHTAAVRAEGFGYYRVSPAGERETYSAVLYLEPFDWRNQRAFGFDMFQEPIRQAAMTRAMETDQAALSGKVILVQETDQDKQAGFLLYVPIYQAGASIDSVEERRRHLIGWTYSPIRTGDFIDAILADQFPDFHGLIDVRIYDGDVPSAEAQLFPTGTRPMMGGEEARRISQQLVFAGRTWTLTLAPTTEWVRQVHQADKGIVILLGGLLTLTLTLAAHLLVKSNRVSIDALAAAERSARLLNNEQETVRAIYDAATMGIFVANRSGLMTEANARLHDMWRTVPGSLIGRHFTELLPEADRAAAIANYQRMVLERRSFHTREQHYQRTDGTLFWGQFSGRALYAPDGSHRGYVAFIADIDHIKRAEIEARLARTVFDHTFDAIVVTDADNNIVSVNGAYEKITGYSLAEVRGKNPRVLKSGLQSDEFYVAMWSTLLATGFWEGELWNRRKNGELFSELLAICVVRDEQRRVVNFVGSFRDTTARREADERIRYLAHYDQLTGLPNRAFFLDRVTQALNLARRYNRRAGVLFIDLDRFKPINDTLGHHAGDTVLMTIATRLKEAVRTTDTPCRQGGDEFLILIPEVESPEHLREMALKLIATIEQPIALADATVSVTASIGAALYPEDGNQADVLIQAADTAMYGAKAQPASRIVLAPGLARAQHAVRQDTT